MQPRWLPSAETDDVHVEFRVSWHQPADIDTAEVRVVGASRYRIFVDGELVGDGPVRFASGHARYQTWLLPVGPGPHVLTARVHSFGVETRTMAAIPGFLAVAVLADGADLPLTWECRRSTEYLQTGRRVSPLLGPLEWANVPADLPWLEPIVVERDLGLAGPLVGTAAATSASTVLEPTAAGWFADRFTGYDLDDPAVQVMLADLAVDRQHADGRWARYDLGRTRLGTPQVVIQAAGDGVVVVAGSPVLINGRVAPVVPLSGGPTALLSRFAVGPGQHLVEPLSALGVQHLEVRAYAMTGPDVEITEARWRSHEQLGTPVGAMHTGDDLLDRIWLTGVETVRACSDDVLVDTPTRERGQWLGDIAACGVESTSVLYGDVGYVGRTLRMAADCAAEHGGIVPGLFPGQRAEVATFAAQWVSSLRRFHECGGSLDVVADCRPAASSTLAALLARVGDDGSTAALPWCFVDWGHEAAGADMPTLLILRRALVDHVALTDRLGADDTDRWRTRLADLSTLIDRLRSRPEQGFHAAALALRDGLIDAGDIGAAADRLESHLTASFPFDPDGVRHRDPSVRSPAIATPYFANVSLAALLRAGRGDFVAEYWRRCWGWMLDQGASTWWEVFDDLWSRCHLWSSAPTWQMSRYLLGLSPRFDRGAGQFDLAPIALTDRPVVSGLIPLPDGGGGHRCRLGTRIELVPAPRRESDPAGSDRRGQPARAARRGNRTDAAAVPPGGQQTVTFAQIA
ncbi:MAG TPA: hypothetical protein VIM10_15035 [Actinopolymorphaceae bacterium]